MIVVELANGAPALLTSTRAGISTPRRAAGQAAMIACPRPRGGGLDARWLSSRCRDADIVVRRKAKPKRDADNWRYLGCRRKAPAIPVRGGPGLPIFGTATR